MKKRWMVEERMEEGKESFEPKFVLLPWSETDLGRKTLRPDWFEAVLVGAERDLQIRHVQAYGKSGNLANY